MFTEGECQMNKAKKFLIFPNLVYLNIISKIITLKSLTKNDVHVIKMTKILKDPLLSLVKSAGLI